MFFIIFRLKLFVDHHQSTRSPPPISVHIHWFLCLYCCWMWCWPEPKKKLKILDTKFYSTFWPMWNLEKRKKRSTINPLFRCFSASNLIFCLRFNCIHHHSARFLFPLSITMCVVRVYFFVWFIFLSSAQPARVDEHYFCFYCDHCTPHTIRQMKNWQIIRRTKNLHEIFNCPRKQNYFFSFSVLRVHAQCKTSICSNWEFLFLSILFGCQSRKSPVVRNIGNGLLSILIKKKVLKCSLSIYKLNRNVWAKFIGKFALNVCSLWNLIIRIIVIRRYFS